MAPTPLAYRIPQAAEVLGVGKSTVWALIARGDLVARKIGAATVIRREDLKAYLDGLPPLTSRAAR